MSLKIEGLGDLNKTLLALSPTFRAEATKVVNRTAQNIRNTAVRSIQKTSGIGTYYKKYDPDRMHIASAPGQSPNTDTGGLAGSIRVVKSGEPTAYVDATVDYAAHLEFGTRNMAARPFMMPAVEEERAKYDTAIEEALRKAIKSSVKKTIVSKVVK